MINSRSLDDLRPDVKAKAIEFLYRCHLQGIDVIVTSTLRDLESQEALYAQGRTKKGAIVTNAPPGFSYHNFGVAFDFCPILYGKCQWKNEKLFRQCGEIGEDCGLEWAGRWMGKLQELAHLQAPDVNLDDLRKEAGII
jgi:peptidoglycan L-alanyl-D-glutamate endopeptidase CwlK